MTSNQVYGIIKQLEEDKQDLKQISADLKEVGETLINYSVSFQKVSDLLFEGYNEGGKRVDVSMSEYVEEYKKYGDELLYLSKAIDAEISKIERELTNKYRLYRELLKEEEVSDRLKRRK